jgi:DNA-directed RNA polymerase specialized sigma24 family protein
MFFALMSRHLNSLYHVVRHELGYLEAVADLPPGELTPEDVVDAVLPRAYQEFLKDPTGRKIKSRVIELAREHLRAEVQRLKAWHQRTPVRLEADVPETPPRERVSTLGDEVLDFHEPDEDLKVEDVIPDLEIPTPEEETETRELQSCVEVAMAGMPRQWRRALLLHHVEGLAGAELAKAIGRPEPETGRILEHASGYLRQRLIESGCGVKGRDSHE